MGTLPPAGKVIVISAGDVGAATLVPPPLRPFYTALNQAYHREFAVRVAAAGGTYVNLDTGPDSDLFAREPQVYLAVDGFHPSSAGYGLWFNALKDSLPAPTE